MRSQKREFIEIGNKVYKVKSDNNERLIIKKSGFEREEYESYQKIKEYLHIPKVKLIKEKEKPKTLVVEQIKDLTIKSAFIHDIINAEIGFQDFIGDLRKMWMKTVQPMEEKRLARNIRLDSIETLKDFLSNSLSQEIINLSLKVNNDLYPTLKDTCTSVLRKLSENKDPIMVLGHGDEHLRNLFLNKDKKSERKYWVIDPRSAGFYSPAHAINNLIGGAHLFFYEYAQKINQTENTISIIYEILPEYQKAKIIIDKNFKLLIESLQNLSKEPFLLKEYLFANLIRSYIKRVNPKRIDEIYKNSQSHLATANELYYKDYVNLF